VIILPTGTYRADEYLVAARRLGVEVVTASERTQALAGVMAEHFIEVPLDEPECAAEILVEHHRRIGFSAVIAVDDVGLLTAALASEALGLRHSPVAAVRLTRDKAAMRRRFADDAVPQPAFEVVSPGTPDGVRRAAEALGAVDPLGAVGVLGRGVVVKPCSLSGSRGVIRADTPEDAAAAARRILPILADAGEPDGSPLLVESFISGPEVAVEAILSHAGLEVIAVFDKPGVHEGPFFEETTYVAPSALGEADLEAVVHATEAAVAALGLTDGPVHAELRLSPETGPVVLEVAARTIGGRCSKALALGGGASLEELVIARALGLPGPSAQLDGPAGVLMIPIPRSGVLEEVHNVEFVRSLPHITGVEITVPLGRVIRALPEGDRYLGFAFARAGSRDEVATALEEAERLLQVTVAG
jgi:biotin carboxylase